MTKGTEALENAGPLKIHGARLSASGDARQSSIHEKVTGTEATRQASTPMISEPVRGLSKSEESDAPKTGFPVGFHTFYH